VARGGRRNQILTVEQEQELLVEFRSRAKRAGMLEVSQIKQAYEDLIGIPFPRARFTGCWLDTAGARSRLAAFTLRSADNGNEPSKKTPWFVAQVVRQEKRSLRLMFQDEARFGRINEARRAGRATGSSGADRPGVYLSVWGHQSP
jgi:hypothetical protein